MQLQPLGWNDPLEKEMVTHFSILAGRIPCTEKPGGLQIICSKESDMIECLSKQGSKRHEFLSNKNGSNEKYKKKLLINIKTQAFFILK